MLHPKKRLAIISHTEHYLTPDGKVVGWGPTITEINHLADDFLEIYHISFLHKGNPPRSALPYTSSNINFIPLSPMGGKGIVAKLKTIFHSPRILSVVLQNLKKVDVFQLRTPTGMGIFLIPFLSLFSKKKGWYKYAGNWNQDNPPLGYAVQRWMLKKQKRKVTINGSWTNQPKQCLTFENPCLTLAERKEGFEVINSKSYKAKFSFCFVGRLEDAKGVQRIIEAFGIMNNKEKIDKIHFIGDGDKMDEYKFRSQELNLPTVFHGFLERDMVFDIYRESHFLLLPSSASEGFPKVIAEAMNYGCIPIVSDVSSISQYINSENGFIVIPLKIDRLGVVLKEAMLKEEVALQNIALKAHYDVVNFTFENYRKRIQKEIIN